MTKGSMDVDTRSTILFTLREITILILFVYVVVLTGLVELYAVRRVVNRWHYVLFKSTSSRLHFCLPNLYNLRSFIKYSVYWFCVRNHIILLIYIYITIDFLYSIYLLEISDSKQKQNNLNSFFIYFVINIQKY